jgi:hypothetical protein
MFNPSALGVALLVLLATTTMVGTSSESDRRFRLAHQSLSSLISSASAVHLIGSSPRQTNTISLSRSTLQAPHTLTVSVPLGATLQGTLSINGQAPVVLEPNSTSLDLSPYLTQALTDVVIEGTYSPASAAVAITFDGPNTKVQQQAGGTGRVNYQLNLVLD